MPGVILIAVGLATYIGIHKLGYDEVALLCTGTLLHWSCVNCYRLPALGYAQLAFWTMMQRCMAG
jgi:hypothetical protein